MLNVFFNQLFQQLSKVHNTDSAKLVLVLAQGNKYGTSGEDWTDYYLVEIYLLTITSRWEAPIHLIIFKMNVLVTFLCIIKIMRPAKIWIEMNNHIQHLIPHQDLWFWSTTFYFFPFCLDQRLQIDFFYSLSFSTLVWRLSKIHFLKLHWPMTS